MKYNAFAGQAITMDVGGCVKIWDTNLGIPSSNNLAMVRANTALACFYRRRQWAQKLALYLQISEFELPAELGQDLVCMALDEYESNQIVLGSRRSNSSRRIRRLSFVSKQTEEKPNRTRPCQPTGA